MGFITIILMLLLGGLAARNLVVQKVPQTQQVLDAVAPHQVYIGLAGVLIGLVSTIQWLVDGLPYIGYAFFYTLVWLVASLALLAVGLIFSSGWISQTFLGAKPDLQAKLADISGKLAAKQELFGLLNIGLGIFYLILTIMY